MDNPPQNPSIFGPAKRELVITRLVTSNNNCYGKGSDLAKMGDPYGAHREVGLPSYPVGKTLITFVMERDPIWQRRRTPDPYGSYTEVEVSNL